MLDDTLLVESFVSHASSPASPSGSQVLYLLYHELRSTPSTYSYVTSTSSFKEHAALFASVRPAGTLLPRITFDDGHLSNLTEALPILLAHQLSANFFITAGWTGTRPGFMHPSHLREVHAAGQHIGAHGLTHTLLTHCSPVELDRELRVARLTLEDILSAPVTTMSLPGGRFNSTVLEACWQAGYTQVFTSIPRAEPTTAARCLGRLNLRADATVPWLTDLLDPSTGTLRRIERTDRLKTTAKHLLGDTLYRRLWSLVNREETEPSDLEGLAQ